MILLYTTMEQRRAWLVTGGESFDPNLIDQAMTMISTFAPSTPYRERILQLGLVPEFCCRMIALRADVTSTWATEPDEAFEVLPPEQIEPYSPVF